MNNKECDIYFKNGLIGSANILFQELKVGDKIILNDFLSFKNELFDFIDVNLKMKNLLIQIKYNENWHQFSGLCLGLVDNRLTMQVKSEITLCP